MPAAAWPACFVGRHASSLAFADWHAASRAFDMVAGGRPHRSHQQLSFDVSPGIAGRRRGVCRHAISIRLSAVELPGVFAAGCSLI